MKKNKRNTITALGFLLPNFLGFLIFSTFPVLFSLIISFSNWDLQRTVPFQWIGLGNFIELMFDRQFWLYFINTIYLMIGMPFAIVGSLFLAILLSKKIKGVVVYRTLFYLPSITSGVALMILWKALYNPDFGPINFILDWGIRIFRVNDILSLFGAATVAPPQWLLSTKNLLGLEVERVWISSSQFGLGARDAIIIMGIWTAIGGNNMLLYLAALSNVPQDLYEAAAIDGAGKWASFKNVTLP